MCQIRCVRRLPQSCCPMQWERKQGELRRSARCSFAVIGLRFALQAVAVVLW